DGGAAGPDLLGEVLGRISARIARQRMPATVAVLRLVGMGRTAGRARDGLDKRRGAPGAETCALAIHLAAGWAVHRRAPSISETIRGAREIPRVSPGIAYARSLPSKWSRVAMLRSA